MKEFCNAVLQGNLKEVASKIEQDPDLVTATCSNGTALRLAIHYKHWEIAKLLLTKGANPNQKNREGSTALHKLACMKDPDISTLKEMFRHGANPNIENDKNKRTPFDCAFYFGQSQEILDLFIHAPAFDPKIALGRACTYKVDIGVKMVKELLKLDSVKKMLEEKDELGYIFLSIAVQHNLPKVVEELLNAGANPVNVMDITGETPISMAVRNRKNPLLLKILVKHLRDYKGEEGTFSQQIRAIKESSHVLGFDSNFNVTEGSKHRVVTGKAYNIWESLNLVYSGIHEYLPLISEDSEEFQHFSEIERALSLTKELLIQGSELSPKIFNAHLETDEYVIVPTAWRTSPVSMPYKGHMAGVAYYRDRDTGKKFLIICNRGAGRNQENQGTVIYEIPDDADIGLEYLLSLPHYGDLSQKEMLDRLYQYIDPAKPFMVFMTKDQAHGNCSFANIKSLTIGILGLKKYLKLAKNRKSVSSREQEDDLERAHSFAHKAYKTYTKTIRDNKIKELLKNYKKALQEGNKPLYSTYMDIFLNYLLAHHGHEKKVKNLRLVRNEKISGELERAEILLKELEENDRKRLLQQFEPLIDLIRTALKYDKYELLKLILQAQKNDLTKYIRYISDLGFIAIKNKDLDFIDFLLQNGYNPCYFMEDGTTLYEYAAQLHQNDIMKLFESHFPIEVILIKNIKNGNLKEMLSLVVTQEYSEYLSSHPDNTHELIGLAEKLKRDEIIIALLGNVNPEIRKKEFFSLMGKAFFEKNYALILRLFTQKFSSDVILSKIEFFKTTVINPESLKPEVILILFKANLTPDFFRDKGHAELAKIYEDIVNELALTYSEIQDLLIDRQKKFPDSTP